MKIALCLSGQARSWKQGYEYYKRNLLDRYDVDVFIHTWDFPERDEYLKLYNPKAFKYDMSPDLMEDVNHIYTRTPNPVKHPPNNTYRMLASMCLSRILMIRSGTEYDWVIKSRSDYALNVDIEFEELDNTKLYIPNCRMVPQRDFGNDQFAFGSQDTMEKYMSTWYHIDKYYEAGADFIGENMMQANLHNYNLHGDNLVYVNMNNPFPPGAHNGTWHSLIRDDYDNWTKDSKTT
jgi:hypothetical protein